jgi:serine/threonine-protein kinase
MYLQMAIWGLIGVSISVYGVAQAAALRKEAFEARQFGQYRLQTKLGGGGMGEVYLAEHQLLRRPSVIKLIRSDRAADPKMVGRFEREVRLMATLTHWNTVQVFDYGHTPDGTFYYVMEFLPGMNLQELVDRHGPLPPGRAVYLLRQVCRGLREAHGVGLIHRDVKPSNVMVCERGGQHDVAKLLDFGLVRGPAEEEAAAHLTDEQTVIGTPSYLSPEQACGKPTDARSDVYSLGATAYFLLTGKPPFVKARPMEVIAAHITEPPRPASDCCAGLPDDLCAAVMRCLAKDPAERFADVRALETALSACGCAADWDEDKAAGWWRATRSSYVDGHDRTRR